MIRSIVSVFVGIVVMCLSMSVGAEMIGEDLSYSDGRIPDVLIRMPENEHAIIVEKKTQSLSVWGRSPKADGYGYQEVLRVACSTGEVAGPKAKAGDKKTPEGVYFLKEEYEDRYLTPVYGKKAFATDYPNFLDHRMGKKGSAIWIHGTNKVLKPMDSNGCVALENDNVMALAQYVQLNATPLIIVEEITRRSKVKMERMRQRLDGFISQWIASLETGSYHKFLAHYESGYLPDIAWWESWLRLRSLAAENDTRFAFQLERTGIYVHNHVAAVLMDMYLTAGQAKKYLGKRQLFIGGIDTVPAIIGDFFQKKAAAFRDGDTVLVAAAQDLIQNVSFDDEVLDMVSQWLAAWSAKDMTKYSAFYAADFFSNGLGKEAWVRRKTNLADQYEYIHVTGSDYRVTRQNDGYVVSFLQNYKSSGYAAQGRKKIKLVKQGGGWKIYRENWKEK
ncbi:MAG: hypothetical protein CSA29_05445 [Desulfobacterales bacterium]|nr:MAG: hypothetical protein CSA29_05445 [Desulfobacterales bacterium]